ncbi:SAM-dependent methyltransferase [Actinosynnema sp. NPDC020468]|uniref:class I SAM-dependent methyltransferase n=1 Tax=Actinosynnema sp. NPDC020468 TaxID=3154488 RepID=UPI003408D12C
MTPSPGRTALTAAAARAAHLLVDHAPIVFADDLAAPLLGDQADALLSYHREHGANPILATARAEVVCRARYAETAVLAAVRRGVDQYVVLGAGLDTFALRNPTAVRVFEVDHPAARAWKADREKAAGMRSPAVSTPVDLTRESLADGLAAVGFDLDRPAVVAWLGVSMYLDAATVDRVLGELGRLAPGSELVFDHLLPEGERDDVGDLYVRAVGPVVAAGGEPWRSFPGVAEATALVRRHGFGSVASVGQRESVDAALWERSDSLRPARVSSLVHARR